MANSPCQYELDRLQRIAENKDRLLSLGLVSAKEQFHKVKKTAAPRESKSRNPTVLRESLPRSAKEGPKVIDSPIRPKRNPRATVQLPGCFLMNDPNATASEWIAFFSAKPNLAGSAYKEYVKEVRIQTREHIVFITQQCNRTFAQMGNELQDFGVSVTAARALPSRRLVDIFDQAKVAAALPKAALCPLHLMEEAFLSLAFDYSGSKQSQGRNPHSSQESTGLNIQTVVKKEAAKRKLEPDFIHPATMQAAATFLKAKVDIEWPVLWPQWPGKWEVVKTTPQVSPGPMTCPALTCPDDIPCPEIACPVIT